jgi:ubiquitin-conjugating enzyme E2 D
VRLTPLPPCGPLTVCPISVVVLQRGMLSPVASATASAAADRKSGAAGAGGAAAAAAPVVKVKTPRDAAVARLQRDLRELDREPIAGVAAFPLERDLLEWHCTITPPDGPYHGVIFHVVLNFPERYPMVPPRASLMTSIPHPNVFPSGGSSPPWICLDLLKETSVTTPFLGWSSSYSVGSILMQLSAFLFDANVPQD